jgi:hypothetical protein
MHLTQHVTECTYSLRAGITARKFCLHSFHGERVSARSVSAGAVEAEAISPLWVKGSFVDAGPFPLTKCHSTTSP